MNEKKMTLISELEEIMRFFIKEFRRDLNDRLGEEFTGSEFAFLRAIRENSNQNVSSLASTLNVSNSHATSIMDRLTEKNLMVRNRSEKDRRVVVFELTEEGERIFHQLNDKRTDYLNQRFQKLSVEELNELIRVFNKL
ncbi:MarR family winged helix-turn-helix transcriptional regulator [Halobacillus sp. BBL2006]|uniref:MarR family winged helix-turn-helix transcriptional regulator n=1 Tax=Halobacillus sp. BBL2006 TaxID=1543706 RepID=UPI0005434281|nr:MarR family transcriptional regulator [Halobacillus sp. BBL2006]KHE68739.1 hypothetical protein LD39_14035 [Halobacillus sp. BBL2006]